MRSIPGSPWIKYKVMPYKEYKPEKLYYSIGEVSEILGESTSLVRFWSDSFPEFVRPERNKKGNISGSSIIW